MRAVERRRKPFMTARKWVLLIILIVVLIFLLISLYYKNIFKPVWNEERYVKSSLREIYEVSEINYLKKYVWDESYWIVKGLTSEDEERLVVWKDLTIILNIPTNELIDEKTVTDSLQAANVKIHHIQPAYFRDVLSYEVQSKNEKGNSIYSFYSMYDGSLLDSFVLPKK